MSRPPERLSPDPHSVDVTDVAARLRLSVTRLARQLRQNGDGGLTPTQLSALAVVARAGPLILGELADIERIAPPTVTKVVDKLVELGLIERRTGTINRRVTQVVATADGNRLLEEIRARRHAWLATRLETLSAEQLARLEAAVDVLDSIVESGANS